MELQWPLILFTFFLCFIGGTMATQGLLNLLGKGAKTQNLALVVSAIGLVVGGISVFLHLEHWERIFNAFGALLAGNGTAVSGITLELWACVVFAVMLLLYFLFARRSEDGQAPKWCAVLAVVVGLAMPVITGHAYQMASIPAWNSPLLIIYYVCNALLLGGLTVLILACIKQDDEAVSVCAKVALVGGIASLLVVVAHAAMIGSFGKFTDMDFYFDPAHPDTPMVDSAGINASILTGSSAGLFWGLAVAIGLLAALVCSLLAQSRRSSGGLGLAAGGLACAVIGSFAWRGILYTVAMSAFALF